LRNSTGTTHSNVTIKAIKKSSLLLVHNLEHFIFPVYPDAASQPGWLNILDEGVFSVIFSPFHRLQQQENGQDKYRTVTPLTDNKQENTYHTE